MAKKDTGPVTHYIAQLYEERKVPRAGMRLEVKNTIPYTKPEQAEDRARRAFEQGQCVGADAFRLTFDPETEITDEPVFLLRLGKVPEIEG